ncbi:hypothetical protein CHS0354_022070 [Potamilus streckersoni]|uniref:Tim44-like domain-containing protein n=1 Tax=Potamilus streckersoni TaxID=2493646 RepID=A0AAE0SS07_9BIVA|nr:hypothetical protein CHS0354_022070 [Potamilus streckersoni]
MVMNVHSLFRYPLLKTNFLTKAPNRRKWFDNILKFGSVISHDCFRVEASCRISFQTCSQFSPRNWGTAPIVNCPSANWRQIRQYHESRNPFISTFSENFKPYISTSFINTLVRNKYFAFFIRHQLEDTFTIDEFKKGAFQAVLHASKCIAQGQLDSLQDLVERHLLQKLRFLIPDMNKSDQQKLEVKEEDVLFKFIHHIGVLFDSEDRSKGTRLEIMFCMQYLRGRNSSELQKLEGDQFIEYVKDNIFICNYRFAREFKSKTESTDWVISDFCQMPVVKAAQL